MGGRPSAAPGAVLCFIFRIPVSLGRLWLCGENKSLRQAPGPAVILVLTRKGGMLWLVHISFGKITPTREAVEHPLPLIGNQALSFSRVFLIFLCIVQHTMAHELASWLAEKDFETTFGPLLQDAGITNMEDLKATAVENTQELVEFHTKIPGISLGVKSRWTQNIKMIAAKATLPLLMRVFRSVLPPRSSAAPTTVLVFISTRAKFATFSHQNLIKSASCMRGACRLTFDVNLMWFGVDLKENRETQAEPSHRVPHQNVANSHRYHTKTTSTALGVGAARAA